MHPSPRALSAHRQVVLIGVAIYVLALGLRLALWYQLKDDPTYQAPAGDMRGNHEFAEQVVKGTLPPNTYYKAPLYSYFLAGVYYVTGIDPTHARIVQIVVTSLSPVLTFLIARRLFDQLVGAIAGLVASVFWTFLFFSTELLDTALASLLYLLLAYLLLVLDDRKWTKWLVCGAVLGLGAITRPNILPFAPVLAIALVVVTFRKARKSLAGVVEFVSPSAKAMGHPRETVGDPIPPTRSAGTPLSPATADLRRRIQVSAWRTALIHVIALTAGCGATVLPVTIRNRVVGGEWVLIGAYGGLNLYVANNPHSDSKDGPLLVDKSLLTAPNPIDHHSPEPWARNCLNYNVALRLGESKLGRKPKPGEFDAILSDMAKDFIRSNPGWFARHAVRRFCWLFNMYEYQSNRNLSDFRKDWGALRVTSYLHFGILCPLAILGLILALSRPDLRTLPMAYYLMMLASLVFPAVLFIINSRFRTPIVHLLMPFAAFGAVQVVGLFRRGVPWSRRVLSVVVLGGMGLFSNANLFDYWSAQKAHILAKYLGACERAGRTDLIDRAYDELEAALTEEMKDLRPGNTSLMLEYGPYMARFFIRHMQKGNVDKALNYGWLMVHRERITPQAFVWYFDVLSSTNDLERVKQVLEVLRTRCSKDHPEVLARCLVSFGRRYQDSQALSEAVRLYEGMVAARPTELSFHQALAEVRALLAGLAPGTQPAGTRAAHPPGREVPK